MDLALVIVALIMGLVGLLGVILPVLPGTILSYAGFLCVYFTTGSSITITQLVIWGVVSVIAIVLDYVLPGYFSNKDGMCHKLDLCEDCYDRFIGSLALRRTPKDFRRFAVIFFCLDLRLSAAFF